VKVYLRLSQFPLEEDGRLEYKDHRAICAEEMQVQGRTSSPCPELSEAYSTPALSVLFTAASWTADAWRASACTNIWSMG